MSRFEKAKRKLRMKKAERMVERKKAPSQ